MKPEERERIVLPPQPVKTETQETIARLQRQCFVELGTVQQFHAWLDDKRHCRQACRVIGDSRTGKTLACDAYRLKHASQIASGDAPTVPVIYWHATTETGQRELFVGLLKQLKYRITNGTISDLRERVYRLLRACQVEMIILDEAHRFRPKTFSEIRDIFDILGIAVVLVGTDCLDAVVRRDEQVHNRFMACHRFHRFDSQTLEETTAIWEEYVLRLPQPSNLNSAATGEDSGRDYAGLFGHTRRDFAERRPSRPAPWAALHCSRPTESGCLGVQVRQWRRIAGYFELCLHQEKAWDISWGGFAVPTI